MVLHQGGSATNRATLSSLNQQHLGGERRGGEGKWEGEKDEEEDEGDH